ncbi:MAG: class I SAM-dependent methyltransferase [Candidatus Thiodiazotropha sp. (ex Dulcina madagascariensis)]|nr:class I SAM-dependent methyltransferase [Candidatus Thiodiazotropha sp. (ex Dulcina madagascariensis)]MCU7927478.1 class I SAM-dependent methyltransferase [Candidatus Thiodiazotropha sp. (ex Dulcina madagascariensis)]
MCEEEYKKRIEATFNDVSRRYDENRFFAISASKMAELVPPAERLKVLDLSTGTGAVAIEIACKHRDASIEAVDLSQGMLEIAKSKARNKGITNIGFRQDDVENIVYDNDTFDVVTCGYGLFFYPDMEATYQAICKAVRPGGMFIFSSFTETAFNPHAELFLRRLESDYKIEAPSRLRERLKTKQQIEALATTSEFNGIDVIHEPIRYPISIAEWWSLLNSAGFKSLLDQLDERQLERFKKAHLMEVKELSDGATVELNADTLFGVVSL